MSEYQYYEFLAVDRPLTGMQIDQVRRFSTRADISATRFVNEYHWGDFRGDPDDFLAKWFDVMVYFANWGTQRLMIGLPADAADLRAWRSYESEGGFEIRKKSERIILDFWSDTEEPEDWPESEGQMASLAPIREELLAGDTRAVFLGWLAGLSDQGLEDDAIASPPIPPGLAELTPAQRAFASFLRVDDDLLSVVARQSPARRPRKDVLASWIASLPQDEKDQILLATVSGDDPYAVRKLLRRYQQSRKPSSDDASPSSSSIGEWLRAAAAIREARDSAERERAARERARRVAEKAAEREKHLNELARRQEQAWQETERLVMSKQTKAYDTAVATLADLREVAIRQQALQSFSARLRTIRDTHRAKVSFIARIKQSGLLNE